MPQSCSRAGFAQKTGARRFITQISLADNLQCHGTMKIDVKRLVSDAHRTPTQLDRSPVFAHHQLVVLKALDRLFRSQLDRVLGSRRLVGLNPAGQSLAKHADRTEFHRSRKLVAAARADSSVLRFHAPNRPSLAIGASQRA
jgi:hypothetical protein